MVNHLPLGNAVATCNRLFQISSESRTIEIDDSIVLRCASDIERDRGVIRRFVMFAFHVPSFWTFRLVASRRVLIGILKYSSRIRGHIFK